MGAIVVGDALWGDAGKGKFSAYLARKYHAVLAVRAGTGTNAGHSVWHRQEFHLTRQLPLAYVGKPDIDLLVSSGVVVDPIIFQQELAQLPKTCTPYVDYRCPLIEKFHIETEKGNDHYKTIGSTCSGSGEARIAYIARKARQACDSLPLTKYTTDGIRMINTVAKRDTVIIEGSQGSQLSLYSSNRYPYVTSDNCNTNSFLDDTSLNWKYLERVVLLVKCLPTCVGAGPLSYEMAKEEVIARGLEENGVVTGRPKRRAFALNILDVKYAVEINGATEIALTFCDQFDPVMSKRRTGYLLTKKMYEFIQYIERETQLQVTYLSTGPGLNDVIDLAGGCYVQS